MTALAARQTSTWFDRLRDMDQQCPWPGPRPLTSSDEELLIGREEDCRSFRHEVDSHRLVVLAGVSGVGKTSLLDAGLQPELARSGYEVAVCREWGRQEQQTPDAVAFLADKVRNGLSQEHRDALPEGAPFFWALKERFDDRLVIVLDQFEELIRFDRALKDDVVDLLVEINARLPVKVIVSLRSEYLHELRELENRATPYTLSRFVLDDVEPGYAEAVVLAPLRGTQHPASSIEDGLAGHIAREWQEARAGSQDRLADPFGRIGLLHLQALLYSLHAEVKGAVVDRAAYDAMKQNGVEGGHASLFAYGVVLAIHRKLQRCERAFEAEHVDAYRLAGVQSLLVRSVPKLASGGYKLVRSARDLLEEVLDAELGVLRGALAKSRQRREDEGDGPPTREQLDALYDVVIGKAVSDDADLLNVSREALAEEADQDVAHGTPWTQRLHPGAEPGAADPSEVSCGPMTGLAPAAVLLEELRRFALMLTWLRATDLVRITSPGGGQLMVSLIHDGFGEGLRQWSERRRASEPAADALHALTAPFGAFFDWTGDTSDIFDGLEGHRVFANLRWRGNTVRGEFRRVVFVSCDFRGTLFDECRFDGVTLVNCRLDGTLFSDCTIDGALDPATAVVDDAEPEFLVEAEHNRLLPAMQHYQGLELELGRVLLAQHLGRPARPAPRSAAGTTLVAPADGGLVVLGGRLSALTIRGTTFAPSARLSVRQVAGSGLDLVEQRVGRLEVLGSAIRHLTVTASSEAVDGGEFELDVRGSRLVQTWLGDGLRGRGSIDDSHLIQFFNGSDDLRLVVTSSTVKESIGVRVEGGDPAPSPDPTDVQASRRMDYVRASLAEDAVAPAPPYQRVRMTTGRDLVEAIRDERETPPPGIATLGLEVAHRWITRLETGEVDLTWPFDAAYTNLEGAVMCSWTVALADQALFFAGMTLCGPREQTRMASLNLSCLASITSGPVILEARTEGRVGGRIAGSCSFRLPDGTTAAVVHVVLDVVPR